LQVNNGQCRRKYKERLENWLAGEVFNYMNFGERGIFPGSLSTFHIPDIYIILGFFMNQAEKPYYCHMARSNCPDYIPRRKTNMNEIFKQKFQARWGDMDSNAHMSNTSYLDVSSDVRMLYFAEHGFIIRDFERLMIGPMAMKDEIEYYREIRLLEHFEVHLVMAGLSEDLTRHRFRNIFYRADGKKAAVVTTTAGFVDLHQRRLVAPPDKLREAMESLERSDDFEVLPNSVK